MREAIQVTTTTATKADAERIAAALVERRLAACAEPAARSPVAIAGKARSRRLKSGCVRSRQPGKRTTRWNRRSASCTLTRSRRSSPCRSWPEVRVTWLGWNNRSKFCSAAMYTLEVRVQPRPAEAWDGEPIQLRGAVHRTLVARPEVMAAAAFPVTCEQAEAALAALPRLFIEPDGSFVWVTDDAQRSWPIDGRVALLAGKQCCRGAAGEWYICSGGVHRVSKRLRASVVNATR